jgi:hypothetical protein
VWLGPERLGSFTWLGESGFRALSYAFSVRWNDERFAAPVLHALGPLHVPDREWHNRFWPPADHTPAFSLVDAGDSEERRYQLVLGYERLYDNPTPAGVLDYFFWRINSDVIHGARDFFLLHAGVLECPGGGAIVLPAGSGSGKSTLVAGLVRAGFGYLSDEFGPVDPVTRHVHGYGKAITLKAGSFGLFPEVAAESRTADGAGQWHLLPEQLGGRLVTAPQPVRVVLTPGYEAGAATELRPLSRAQTLVQLAECALGHGPYGRRGFTLLTEIAADVRGYALTSGSLDEAVAAVAGVFADVR